MKFGLRWYEPTTGTWTQQDTLDAPLDPGNANRYGFAGGDPVNQNDPTGRALSGNCSAGLAVAGIGLALTAAAAAPFTAGGSLLLFGAGVGSAFAGGVVSLDSCDSRPNSNYVS